MSYGPRILISTVTAVIVLTLDQASKQWALAFLPQGRELTVIEGWLWFRLTTNTGATLGLLSGYNNLFLLLTLLVVIAIVVLILRGHAGPSRLAAGALGAIAGGALGNLVDRVRLGAVVDFIELHFWPTDFNLADAAIRLGVLLFVVALLLDVGRRSRKAA